MLSTQALQNKELKIMLLNNNPIKTSLELIQTEKMVIILKELENIERVLDFFNGYNDYSDKYCEKKPIKKNIRFLRMDIISLQEKIQLLQEKHKSLQHSEDMIFLIHYDYVRTQIEDMLEVIHALYDKMRQLFGETLNQYLPYPILGRRYSNHGIMMYLNNYYRELLKSFSLNGQPPKELILGWSFRTGFKYNIFINREIKRENYEEDTYNNYIDLPYWYNELPMLLPAITHEVLFIALRKPNRKLSQLTISLKKSMDKLLNNPNNQFVQKVQELVGYPQYTEDLTKLIVCDLVSHRVHGDSYIHALFHNTIGEKISKDYLKIVHNNQKEERHFLPNEWFFHQKKDHSILRLHLMITLLEDKRKQTEMLHMLNTLMPLNQEVDFGFSKHYKEQQPSFENSYVSVKNYLEQLLATIQIWHKSNEKLIRSVQTLDEASSPNFPKLWEERFDILSSTENHVVHQNNFRREIHKNVSGIEFLKDKNLDSEPIIHILELGKARKDINSSQYKDEKIDIMQYISDEIERKAKDKAPEVKKMTVYGIYDWVTLHKKESIIDIKSSFNRLSESSLNKEKNNENKKPNLRYFTSKQVLMKIHETTLGEITNDTNSRFSVIFNIELEKKIDSNDCSNGYKKLREAIDLIASKLKENKDNFKEANIYKTLGPKDLTVIIEEASLTFIFNFLSLLNKEAPCKNKPKILRTFTILCSQLNEPAPSIDDNFSIVSYLRISNIFTVIEKGKNDINIMLENIKEDVKSFHEITGVMDFRIEWREGTKVKTVLNFYNDMLQKRLLTDFQTKIEKSHL